MDVQRDQVITRVILKLLSEVNHILDDGVRVVAQNDVLPIRQIHSWHRLDIEARDDTEIRSTAFQCLEEIRICRGIGLDYGAICKYDFVVDNSITPKAVCASVVCDSTTEQKATNTDVAISSACDSHIVVVEQVSVGVPPTSPGLEARYLDLGIVGGAVHVAEINGDPVDDVAGSRESMTSAANCDVPVTCALACLGQCFDSKRDLLGVSWGEQTPRVVSSVAGEVGLDARFVF